jgi:PTS system cellobiose-specific IIC component
VATENEGIGRKIHMQSFTDSIETKIMSPMMKLANQRHLSAIRDGLIAVIPLTVVGSLFLLVANLPWPQGYVNFLEARPELVSQLMIPYQMSVGLLSLYASFAISSSLAREYKLDSTSAGVSALFTFLVTLNFSNIESINYVAVQFLSAEGLFTVILTSIFAVEVMKLCEKRNWVIRLPEQVPSNVARSFSSLIPITLSMSTAWILVHIIGLDINNIISSVVPPRIISLKIRIVLIFFGC